MSTDEKCCEALVDCRSNVSVLMSIIEKYPGQEEIVVRITYALGNILTNNENARQQVMLLETFLSTKKILNLVRCTFVYLHIVVIRDTLLYGNIFEFNAIILGKRFEQYIT